MEIQYEHRQKLIDRAKEAEYAFIKYLQYNEEEKKNYEQLINYEKHLISMTKEPYKKEAYIYCLYDPYVTTKTCYVGVTDNLDRRIQRHIDRQGELSNFNRKKNWMNFLEKQGIVPEFIVVDIIPPFAQWQLYESFYIAYYKYIGIELCNGTRGGDGNVGYVYSDELKAKMSAIKIQMLKDGTATMPTNRASGKDAGKYRHDIDDDMLIELYKAGNSIRKIETITGMEHHAVKERLIKAGINIEKNAAKDTTKYIFPLEQALELHNQGYSCNAIAKTLNMSDGKTVKKHLQQAGIVFEKSNYSRKNLDDQIDRIKELYDRGFNYSQIGNMFNTSGTTIKNYLRKAGIVE